MACANARARTGRGRFLDEYEYEHVSSIRGDDHFATMLKDLTPYATSRPVRQLAVRARGIAQAKG